jgi:cytoskeletal protein CcmA (bactofilin family)
MSIWKDTSSSKSSPSPSAARDSNAGARTEAASHSDFVAPSLVVPMARNEPDRPRKESLIASDLTIEGKIEGAGSVRIAGKFKGDVNVQGDLTIEAGAKLTGGVRAQQVIIAGELEGNIEGAARVELQPTAVVSGDVKAGSLTVAAGARMRGHAVFGWEDERSSAKLGVVAESGASA